jgi:hypothetical protein
MKGDIKYGFYLGLGLLGAVLAWHLLGRAGGSLVEGAAL